MLFKKGEGIRLNSAFESFMNKAWGFAHAEVTRYRRLMLGILLGAGTAAASLQSFDHS